MKKFFKETLWGWCKRHQLVAGIILCLFICSFFMRAESMFIRCQSQEVHEYVRVDYSIYGFCIGVKPMRPESEQAAKDLTKNLLFCDLDKSVDIIVDKWSDYYGADRIFALYMRGYRYNAVDKRDELIEKIKSMGYRSDILV